MAVTQYIGARYVPLFADPLDWDSGSEYEPLTIVYYQGNSYTSRQSVPKGIDINNESYWALTGNYNAQIEGYRREVLTFDGRITDNTTAINTETQTRISEDSALTASIEAESTARIAAIQAESEARTEAIKVVRRSALSNRAGYAGSTFMVFGDSFTDNRVAYSEYGQWPNAIRDAFNVTMRNYGVSGSGFYHGNANLSTQIDAANANMTDEQKADVSVIIVYYGYNDLSNNESDSAIMNSYNHFIEVATANYPNARIIMIPFNYGAAVLSMTREMRCVNLIQSMRDVSAGYPIEIIDNARFWLLGQFGWFKDSVHPNQTGFKQITQFITNAILGNSTKVHRAGTVTLDAGVEQYKACQWVQEDGLVHIYARYVPSAAATNQTTVLLTENELPPIMKPELVIQTPVSGVNASGLFTLGDTLRAYQYTVNNATTALIMNTTIRASASKQWSA